MPNTGALESGVSTTASPAYRRREPPNLKPTAAAPGRFLLHGRAPATLRRHMSRSLARIAVLATADAAALLLARAGFAWTIAGPLSPFSGLVSTHRLAGIEFLSAYWVGLLAAGSYGQGDSRRDLRRLLWGVMLGAGLTLWGGLWPRSAKTTTRARAYPPCQLPAGPVTRSPDWRPRTRARRRCRPRRLPPPPSP